MAIEEGAATTLTHPRSEEGWGQGGGDRERETQEGDTHRGRQRGDRRERENLTGPGHKGEGET